MKPFPSDPPYSVPCTELPVVLPCAVWVNFPSLPTEYFTMFPLPNHDSSKQYNDLSAEYSSSHAGVVPHPVTEFPTDRVPPLPLGVKVKVNSFPV